MLGGDGFMDVPLVGGGAPVFIADGLAHPGKYSIPGRTIGGRYSRPREAAPSRKGRAGSVHCRDRKKQILSGPRGRSRSVAKLELPVPPVPPCGRPRYSPPPEYPRATEGLLKGLFNHYLSEKGFSR